MPFDSFSFFTFNSFQHNEQSSGTTCLQIDDILFPFDVYGRPAYHSFRLSLPFTPFLPFFWCISLKLLFLWGWWMSGEFLREGWALLKMERWLAWEVMGFLAFRKWIFYDMIDFFIFSISSLYIIEYLAHKINYFNHHRPHHRPPIFRPHLSLLKSSLHYPWSRS